MKNDFNSLVSLYVKQVSNIKPKKQKHAITEGFWDSTKKVAGTVRRGIQRVGAGLETMGDVAEGKWNVPGTRADRYAGKMTTRYNLIEELDRFVQNELVDALDLYRSREALDTIEYVISSLERIIFKGNANAKEPLKNLIKELNYKMSTSGSETREFLRFAIENIRDIYIMRV